MGLATGAPSGLGMAQRTAHPSEAQHVAPPSVRPFPGTPRPSGIARALGDGRPMTSTDTRGWKAAPTPPALSTAPLTPPPRLRRRPSLVMASALLVVLGALASVWAYTSLGNAQEVVAVRTDVARGQLITADTLQVVRIGVDPALRTVPADQSGALVGMRAAVDLKAGQLLVPGAVTTAVVPGQGRSAVGLSLTAAQMPSEPLVVGDRVRIVSTPGAQGDVETAALVVFSGAVITVADVAADGTTAVTVEVDAAKAPELAARSASGKVALVLDSRVR